MTITSQTTRQGKVIHLLSLDDLVDAVERRERLRAYCPIHGGDHQRSLSIDSSTGWGFCHCCHATVLVETINPMIADKRGSRDERRGADSDTRSPPSCVDQFPPSSFRPDSVRPGRSATPIPHWQQDEVAALMAVAPLMRESLASSQRVQVYLNERGIPLATALASGSGYLSRAVWEQANVAAEQLTLLQRWIGRIVFPLGSPDGRGLIGRTLLRWEPGMDENTHKAVLDRPGAPRRWIKTNPAGWFGFDAPGQLTERVVLVEGGFDRLALLAAGFPASTVIALVGTAARSLWLARSAPQVKGVVLALDADESGKTAMARLAGEFRQARLPVTLCPPPHDRFGKDWSERWRRLGPQSMWPLYEAFAQHHTTRDERT
jgi:hypothetical protein